jgi:hypothetical protein
MFSRERIGFLSFDLIFLIASGLLVIPLILMGLLMLGSVVLIALK